MDDITIYVEKGKSIMMEYGPKLLTALLLLVVGLWVIKLLRKAVSRAFVKAKLDVSLQKFLSNLIGWALKIMLFISVLGQLGVESTSFVAILGAAGLAIGLALQGSLSNFAGGVLIMIFKPFKLGDYIEAQGEKGTVKDIQIFTTKLNSPDNKEIIIPNGALSNGNITNYSSEPIRRVDLVMGVSYDADIKQTKDLLLNVLVSNKRVLKNPAPIVVLGELADSSVNFLVRPFVKGEEYWDVYFEVMEACKLALDDAGIEIPFPQMDIHKK